MSLEKEITESGRTIATDAYDMSIGELINIYRDGELIVSPEYQRLFRWKRFQKSHLIESILIGIPLPSIFVFEAADGKWELIDGLQRVSTILEFVGVLKGDEGLYTPSVLEATRYLPSLENVSWEGGDKNKSLGSAHQIMIKRSRISIQILRKSSDPKAKFDLFQRLNSYGSVATPQELRNNILYMIDKEMFATMKDIANDPRFVGLIHPTDLGSETQIMMDYVTRFFVFIYIDFRKKWDVEEYLNNGLIQMSELPARNIAKMISVIKETIELFESIGEKNILRRYSGSKFQGRVGQAAFETVFLGVAQNIGRINKKASPADYVLSRTKSLWGRADVQSFTRAGLRGTDRIRATVPFGKEWFAT